MPRETDFSAEGLLQVRAPGSRVRECLCVEWLGIAICHVDPRRTVCSGILGQDSLVSQRCVLWLSHPCTYVS